MLIADSEKSRFIKQQEAIGVILSLTKSLGKIPLGGPILFCRYKMVEIITFLLAGDKLMSEMHLRERGFSYSACGSFTKNKENTKI